MQKPDWRESRYKYNNYCSNCGVFVLKSRCITKKQGGCARIFCPDCHCRVRLHSRNRYWRNKKEKENNKIIV